MADAGVQPTSATFRILAGIYQEFGMDSQLQELKQLQTTMAVLRTTR